MPTLADLSGRLPAGLDPESRILLYDGDCGFCSRNVALLGRWNRAGRIRFESHHSDLGQAVLRACGLPVQGVDTMVFVERGRVTTKSRAFLRLVDLLDWPWPLFKIAALIPAAIRDGLYDLVARNRYRLSGAGEACRVTPTRPRPPG